MRNPQALKQYEELRKNNGDPRQLLNQITGNYTPEQKQQFMEFFGSYLCGFKHTHTHTHTGNNC